MTSAPSKPPSVANCAWVISASVAGSFSSNSRKRWSQADVVEAGALAVNLMREAAGRDDDDAQIFG